MNIDDDLKPMDQYEVHIARTILCEAEAKMVNVQDRISKAGGDASHPMHREAQAIINKIRRLNDWLAQQ